jgi:hypothetical protein
MRSHWTYLDFLIPFRHSGRSDKKRWQAVQVNVAVFFGLELLTEFILLVLIFSVRDWHFNINENSGVYTLFDLVAFLSWFLVAGVYWKIFDIKYQLKKKG